MVQFISAPQPKPKSVASQLLEGAAEGALSGYQTYLMQKERNRLLAKEQKETEEAKAKEAKKREAYEKLGIPADVDPQIAKEILKQRGEDKRRQDIYDMFGLKKSAVQQALGTDPQAQGMPQAMGQPTPEPGVGETDTAWMDAVGLPQQDRAKAPEAMSAWENMSDEQRTAIAIQEPQLARILEQGREFNQRQRLSEREFLFKQQEAMPGKEFSKIREKAVAEYVNNAITGLQEAEDMMNTIDTAEKAIKGDITGPGLTAIAKNNPYAQLFLGLTEDEALLQATNKKLLEGTKGIFGSKPTEREIFLLLNSMLPSIGKTQEANLAGLNFIKRINEMKLLHSQIVMKLTNGGIKYIPDLEQKVSQSMTPFAEKLRDDLIKANEQFGEQPQKKEMQKKSGAIKVKAPDGTLWEMTQEQIDNAKKEGVEFAPV